jgi:hypothetical protein
MKTTKTTKAKTIKPQNVSNPKVNLRKIVEVGAIGTAAFLGGFWAMKEIGRFMNAPVEEKLDEISKGIDLVKGTLTNA